MLTRLSSEQMISGANLGNKAAVGIIGCGMIIGVVGCRNLPNKPGTTQIAADRGVEYLDLTPGEIPQWRKQGEITLPIEAPEDQ